MKTDYRYWKTKKSSILVTDMSDRHLLNAIKSSKKYNTLSHWTSVLEGEVTRRKNEYSMINLRNVNFNWHKYTKTLFVYLDTPSAYTEPIFNLISEKFYMKVSGRTMFEYTYSHSVGRRDYYKVDGLPMMLIVLKRYPKEQDITKPFNKLLNKKSGEFGFTNF